MDFFEAVQKRRSIRKFLEEEVPEEVIEKAFDAALLAPNSSNIQAWDFFWIHSKDAQKEISHFCLNQSAARTARELIVVTANSDLWKRSRGPLIDWVKSVKAPKLVVTYYEKLIPITYRPGFLNVLSPFKKLVTFSYGLFRPITRTPITLGDLQEVAIKSAALASENFVLAITAQGYASCMMEGFDENRVKRFLKLPSRSRVVMIIGVGKESDRGTWGPQFRLPKSEVVHRI
jgi:nitroreductase